MKTFFKKLEYRFFVESTEIKNASFLYKTALPEADIEINRIGGTKWTRQKQRSFASNNFFFFFLKTFLQSKNLL